MQEPSFNLFFGEGFGVVAEHAASVDEALRLGGDLEGAAGDLSLWWCVGEGEGKEEMGGLVDERKHANAHTKKCAARGDCRTTACWRLGTRG